MTELLFLLAVLVLVAANGFFVAAEFSLVRTRESRIEQLRDEGKRSASLVLRQIDHIDEYLSACQLGITMASLGIGFLGEPAIASLIEDLFGDSISHSLSLAISLTFAYLVTTALLAGCTLVALASHSFSRESSLSCSASRSLPWKPVADLKACSAD